VVTPERERQPGAVRRLNWGCGTDPRPGWINSDRKDRPGIDLSCDLLDGLPLPSESVDYAVSIHALPEVPHPQLVPALEELRRVLKPRGVLRLALPDLDRGIGAYLRGERDYFLIPDEHARSLGGKLGLQLTWYGYSRTLFTTDFIEELLYRAGFPEVRPCAYRTTTSPFPAIVELDNRERESLFVEALK
jgi:SAM-dependent methyltransferase